MSITPVEHELNAIIVEQANRLTRLNRALDAYREDAHRLLGITQQQRDALVAAQDNAAADMALLHALLARLGLPEHERDALLRRRHASAPHHLARQILNRLPPQG